jgi:hypothetical protein
MSEAQNIWLIDMKLIASIVRTSTQFATIAVEIPDEELAGKTQEEIDVLFENKALEEAGNTEFIGEKSSDYDIENWSGDGQEQE